MPVSVWQRSQLCTQYGSCRCGCGCDYSSGGLSSSLLRLNAPFWRHWREHCAAACHGQLVWKPRGRRQNASWRQRQRYGRCMCCARQQQQQQQQRRRRCMRRHSWWLWWWRRDHADNNHHHPATITLPVTAAFGERGAQAAWLLALGLLAWLGGCWLWLQLGCVDCGRCPAQKSKKPPRLLPALPLISVLS